MTERDPYAASLVVTLFFFYGTAAMFAWVASNWPLAFASGVVLFFLLIYGKIHKILRCVGRFGGNR